MMTTREALKAANDRQMSLEADPSEHKRELQQAFRNGYAQHRNQTQRLLTDMVAELDSETGWTFPGDAGSRDQIKAEAHSDDHRVTVSFDAAPWFRQADDSQIMALAKINFGRDYGDAADDVARFFDTAATESLFEYLSHNPVGFECQIDDDDAMNWLRQHRPDLVTKIEGQNLT